LGSNSLGTINTGVSMNPSVSNEWTSLANLYDEFRVMGCRVRLVSKQQGSVTALTDALVTVYDNDNFTALTSYDLAFQYQNARVSNSIWTHQTEKENQESCITYAWRRPTAGGNTSISWIDTQIPAGSLGSVKWFATNLTASTVYHTYFFEWFVEFRGRQ